MPLHKKLHINWHLLLIERPSEQPGSVPAHQVRLVPTCLNTLRGESTHRQPNLQGIPATIVTPLALVDKNKDRPCVTYTQPDDSELSSRQRGTRLPCYRAAQLHCPHTCTCHTSSIERGTCETYSVPVADQLQLVPHQLHVAFSNAEDSAITHPGVNVAMRNGLQ